MLAIAAVNRRKPLSISGWKRGMIEDVFESVVSRNLSKRTSWSYGCTKCKGRISGSDWCSLINRFRTYVKTEM